MEKRIAKKVRLHQVKFKEDIKKWIIENSNAQENKELIEFVFQYPLVNLTQSDFEKRKRIKNIVPLFERCTALRANHEQCTRRRRDGSNYCGTHIKGQPHGIKDNLNNQTEEQFKKVTVWQEEIQGIIYHIDDNNNVYDTNDIMENKVSPPIIAKWEKDENGKITIPQLFNRKK
jgi:hypothetical protein